MDYQPILEEIRHEVQPLFGHGKVADYIPELAGVNPNRFGMAISAVDGRQFAVGDAAAGFSIQSISKVFSLVLAFKLWGDRLWTRVGKEPSGNPFNSLVQLEFEQGIPRNPFINAGALVIADILLSHYDDPRQEMLDFVRRLSGNAANRYDPAIAASEKTTGFTNAALANFLKSRRNLRNEVEAVLDVYFHFCSLHLSCVELAQAFLLFANHGVLPATGERILTKSQAKRLMALMLTCGFYDEAGEVAFRVGLPGKSGVGGGIAAVIPGELSLAVWSPEINKFGNSVVGIQALELFTTKTEMSVF